MSTQTCSLVRLLRVAAKLSQQQETGCLVFAAGEQQCQIYFYKGRVAYAVREEHRIRRWQRALKQQQVNLSASAATAPAEPWEYYQLLQGVKQQQLSPAKANAIIAASLQEVLFAIASHRAWQIRWQASWPLASHAQAALTVPGSNFKQLLSDTHSLWVQWQSLNMPAAWADAAPLLQVATHLTPSTASQLNLRPLLNGKRTIWDLVVRMNLSLAAVTRLLHHYVQQGSIEFKALRDLPAPTALQPAAMTAHPLVACVDDSPQVCNQVKRLLSTAGYRHLCFQDSTQALPALIQQPPDLILLDLVMPVVNGYELCAHLRRVPALAATPIILMTGNKGLVDRLRAKLVGASDLILKPLDRDELLSLIARRIQPQSPNHSSLPRPTVSAALQPAVL